MSELGNTTNPVEKPVENAEKVDEAKLQEQHIETASESKGKGKGKAAEAPTDEEDDDDDDDDDDDEDDEDDDDEDDFEVDEVDPSDIIPPSSRRSARSGQIDYSSEEAIKKAGLAAAPADEDDEEFKADETMEED